MTTARRQQDWPRWVAWLIWILCFTVILADVVRKPDQHTTTPTYRFASTQWWKGLDPYTFDQPASLPTPNPQAPWMEHHDEFLYFPQAAFLFTPYNVLPFLLGEILWRATTFGLFLYALVRLNAFFVSGNGQGMGRNLVLLSLLAVPSAFASLRNAQFDLPLAALLVLASAEIAAARWTPAAIWLCVALALKPLAAVPILLFGALYWRLIPRVIAGVLIVLALPFLHWNPAFVAHEYVRCGQALAWASVGDAPKFSDLSAMLSHFGYDAPEMLKTVARVLFALVYLGLGAWAFRRLNRVEAAWTIGALSADYLMLFNPRTETCSYVFLGPFVASLALFYVGQPGRKWLTYVLGFAALGLACDAIPVLHGLTDRWFKALIALFFLPAIVEFIHWRNPGRELTESEFKATFEGKMTNVSEAPEPRADVWEYIKDSGIQLPESVLENNWVDRVYRNATGRYDHVLIPVGRRNVFLVIVVDRKRCSVFGHKILDLNAEYGLDAIT